MVYCFDLIWKCYCLVMLAKSDGLIDCHSLLDSANGQQNFLSVRVRSHVFLVRSSCGECVPYQVISVLSGPIRWQVLDMFKASNGRHRIKMSGG